MFFVPIVYEESNPNQNAKTHTSETLPKQTHHMITRRMARALDGDPGTLIVLRNRAPSLFSLLLSHPLHPSHSLTLTRLISLSLLSHSRLKKVGEPTENSRYFFQIF